MRGMFLENSGNIVLRLLEFAKRFVIMKSYTYNTKTTFPSRTFDKIFFFKMFPKCSLDVLDIVTLREYSANIPGISRAGWVPFQKIQTAVLKGTIAITQVTSDLVKLESDRELTVKDIRKSIIPVIRKCYEAMAFLGHANQEAGSIRRTNIAVSIAKDLYDLA